MITQEKVKIYNRFQGDIDGWARRGSKKEKSIMSDVDWSLIDSLVQDIRLIQKELTSKEFSDALQIRLSENCNNPETISQLEKIANKL